MKNNLLIIVLVLSFLWLNSITYAALSGTYTIPGSYATIAAAITDLNTQGAGTGGVTFNVAANYTETFSTPNSGVITASGTSSNPIVFQKSGSGSNPIITAATGTGLADGIIIISGGSYITFDGIDVKENVSNATIATQMEWGYALLKANGSSPFVGCQNLIIKNCNISLNRSNYYSVGIYSGNHTLTSPNTQLAISAASDAMNNCYFYSNSISNVFTGIKLRGDSVAVYPFTLFDQNNGIGITETGSAAGNTITNFGNTNTSSSWPIYGIYVSYQNNIKIKNNSISNSSISGSDTYANLYGIYLGNAAASNADVASNTITLTNANALTTSSTMVGIYNVMSGTGISSLNIPTAGTINIFNNTIQNCSYSTAAASSSFYGIQNTQAVAFINIYGNTINNNTYSGTGAFYGIDVSYSGYTNNFNVNNNTITNNVKTNYGQMHCIRLAYGFGTCQCYSNTIAYNYINNASTSTSSCTMYGLNFGNAAISESDYNNSIHDIGVSSSTAANTGYVYGMYYSGGNSNGTRNVYSNQIYNLSFNASNAGTYGTSVYGYGINMGAYFANLNLYKNKIYNVTAYGTTSSVTGINVGAYGYNNLIYNNFISDLSSPIANSVLYYTVCGLSISNSNSSSFSGAYFNTIYLNSSSSGANFSATGFYAEASKGTIELQNNIIINNSTPQGTGYVCALRRNAASFTTYSAGSDNNDFYVSSPGANSLIYYDGTNSAQTISAFKGLVISDSHSFTEMPAFVNSVTKPYDLRIQTGTATNLESGGVPVTKGNVSDDYYGTTRNSSNPDVGAYEFNGISVDNEFPVIKYTPILNTASTSSQTLIATITDISGVPTSGIGLPVLWWKINSGIWNQTTAVSLGGGQYSFTFGSGVVSGDIVYYYITAQDLASTPNAGSLPSSNGSFTVNPPTAITPPTPNSYTILPGMSGTYYIGPTGDFTRLKDAVNTLNGSIISGPTTFIINADYAGVSDYPVTLNQNAGSSSVNTLTIKPAAPGITLTGYTSSTSSGQNYITINGFSYLTIDGSSNGTTSRDLTIRNIDPAGGSITILVASLGPGKGATHITIKNCNIAAQNKMGDIAIKVASASSDIGDNNDYCTIQNNNIYRANIGILFGGTIWVPKPVGLNILNNYIGGASISDTANSVYKKGIYISAANAPVISGNEVCNMLPTVQVNGNYGGVIGIDLYDNISDAVVNNNKIYNLISYFAGLQGVTGISLGSTYSSVVTNAKVYNNFVGQMSNQSYGNTSYGTIYSPVGIRVHNANNSQFDFNTVNLSGNQGPGVQATLSAAFAVDGGNDATISYNITARNNIFINNIVGSNSSSKFYAVYVKNPATFSTINYNNYFVSGTYEILGNYYGVDYTALSGAGSWQSITTQDVKSVSDTVRFVSSNDPHLTGASIGDVLLSGTSISGITTDIDGETRNAVPYMGADENISIPLPLELTAFTSSVKGRDVILSWTTASEKNSYSFQVERAQLRNNVIESWTTVTTLPAAGNTNSPRRYMFTDKKLSTGKFVYRLKMVDNDGSSKYSQSTEAQVTGPSEFMLSQNYPNPFNPSTKIDYQVPVDARVTIEVYNITGQRVAQLLNSEQSAGFYTIEMNKKDLASGVYIYRMTAVDQKGISRFTECKKLLLLK